MIEPYVAKFVSREHRDEMAAIAEIIGRPEAHVQLGNLYYEAFRQLMGCTAFACDTPNGPIHARNLDWWTEDQMLARSTCIVHSHSGASVGAYRLVTWPGFIGALSGLAPERFATTLNAVISNERPTLAPPVVLLIRRAFETCRDFCDAVDLLERSPIAADCLLLVTGTKPGEMVVIERTSTRAAIRRPTNGFIVVTNDYRSLDARAGALTGNRLQETACGRFDRATELVRAARPVDAGACMGILGDDKVRMSITVQQMVMSPRTGELQVQIAA
jgi:predicted choloylglycine hydrolase